VMDERDQYASPDDMGGSGGGPGDGETGSADDRDAGPVDPFAPETPVNPGWRDQRKGRRSSRTSGLVLNETQELQFADERDDDEGTETVNPEWRERRKGRSRRTRSSRRSSRTQQPLPRSPQEVQRWLQQGGWRYVAALAVLVLVGFVVVLSFGGGDNKPDQATAPTRRTPSAVRTVPVIGGTVVALPTVTPAPSPSPTPGSQIFIVSNTGTQGLFLRATHTTDGQILETLPEGTRVEQVGEDFTGPNYVWRNIRAPSGQEGWVAIDWLRPAP
jgi:hypothetical protein